MKALFDRPTVAGALDVIEDVRSGVSLDRKHYDDVVHLDLDAEAALDDDVVACAPVPGVGSVLVTGASSLVGAVLVRGLLTTTDRTVHCLVPSASSIEAVAAWLDDGLVAEHLGTRLIPVVGSATRAELGLSTGAYERLAGGGR